jgi:uncharacterized membrane protein
MYYRVKKSALSSAFFSRFLIAGQSRLDRALSVLLVISIVGALATTVYVIAVPKGGYKFTTFYILGPDGMAADYPGRTLRPSIGTTRFRCLGSGSPAGEGKRFSSA